MSAVLDTPAPVESMLAAVRRIADGPLAAQAAAIDRGTYPEEVLRQLGAAGAYRAHLEDAAGAVDFGAAIGAIAEVSRVCGATGFMVWCHAVCGIYMERVGEPGAGWPGPGRACRRPHPGRDRHEQSDEDLRRHRAAAAQGTRPRQAAATPSMAPCRG